jgi:hypothetical protein
MIIDSFHSSSLPTVAQQAAGTESDDEAAMGRMFVRSRIVVQKPYTFFPYFQQIYIYEPLYLRFMKLLLENKDNCDPKFTI